MESRTTTRTTCLWGFSCLRVADSGPCGHRYVLREASFPEDPGYDRRYSAIDTRDAPPRMPHLAHIGVRRPPKRLQLIRIRPYAHGNRTAARRIQSTSPIRCLASEGLGATGPVPASLLPPMRRDDRITARIHRDYAVIHADIPVLSDTFPMRPRRRDRAPAPSDDIVDVQRQIPADTPLTQFGRVDVVTMPHQLIDSSCHHSHHTASAGRGVHTFTMHPDHGAQR